MRPVFTYKKDADVATLRAIVVRVAVFLLAGLWTAVLPIFLCVIYMLQEGFFSYDFFLEGIFGLKIFLFVGAVVLVMLAVYLWGFLSAMKHSCFALAETGRSGNARWAAYGLWACAALFHYGLIYWSVNRTGRIDRYLIIAGMSLFISGFYFLGIGQPVIAKLLSWRASFTLILMTATIPMVDRETTADLVGVALSNFNVGGSIPAAVFRNEDADTPIFQGKLLLLTSRNAYFRHGKSGFRVFQLSEGMSVAVGRASASKSQSAPSSAIKLK